MFEGGFDKISEEGLRLEGRAVEFGVKLGRAEPRVVFHFNNFDQLVLALVVDTADNHRALFLKYIKELVIEFVAVTMTLMNKKRTVKMGRFGSDSQLTRLQPQTHCPATNSITRIGRNSRKRALFSAAHRRTGSWWK